MKTLNHNYVFFILLLVLVAVAAAGCQKTISDGKGNAVALQVNKYNPSDDWGETAPIMPSDEGHTFSVSIAPANGNFNGWARIDVAPGQVLGLTCNPPDCNAECAGTRAINQNIRIDNSRVDLCVSFKLAFGATHITAKDIGFEPSSPATAACSDGIDNDGDGRVDYGNDGGCAFANDNTEEEGRYIVGASPTIMFADPRIENVQGYTSYSPLDKKAVTIKYSPTNPATGRIVVTRISTEGFYVTDIDPMRPGQGFNHLYAYNYNTPWGLRECDVLTLLDGIVGEFFGFTELGFPTYQVLNPEGRVEVPASSADCPIPEPTTLTGAMITDIMLMESLESGLVQVQGGIISERFINCDLNGDGMVEWEGAEDECNTDCENDPGCTELTQYGNYYQWNLNSGGTKVFVISKEAFPDFDPIANSGQSLQLVRGTLKQVEFIDPPWIVEIRCRDDLVAQSGVVKPIYQACVPPQPRGVHYDDN